MSNHSVLNSRTEPKAGLAIAADDEIVINELMPILSFRPSTSSEPRVRRRFRRRRRTRETIRSRSSFDLANAPAEASARCVLRDRPGPAKRPCAAILAMPAANPSDDGSIDRPAALSIEASAADMICPWVPAHRTGAPARPLSLQDAAASINITHGPFLGPSPLRAKEAQRDCLADCLRLRHPAVRELNRICLGRAGPRHAGRLKDSGAALAAVSSLGDTPLPPESTNC